MMKKKKKIENALGIFVKLSVYFFFFFFWKPAFSRGNGTYTARASCFQRDHSEPRGGIALSTHNNVECLLTRVNG